MLGHELTHIRNGDVRMLVIAVVIAGVISFFGEMVFRYLFQNAFMARRCQAATATKKGGGAAIAIVIAIVLIVVAWVLSIVVRFALSRQRVFLADFGSVELTKNPDAMISALRKIENRGELASANSAVMEMCIDNPRSGFAARWKPRRSGWCCPHPESKPFRPARPNEQAAKSSPAARTDKIWRRIFVSSHPLLIPQAASWINPLPPPGSGPTAA